MRIIQGSALFIVILFGLFGAIALGIVLHEYSHAQDFSQVAENEEICALTIPTDSSKLVSMGLAYYSFEADSSNPKAEEEIERISKYTEFKAYAVTLTVLMIFVISMEIVFRWMKREIIEKTDLHRF